MEMQGFREGERAAKERGRLRLAQANGSSYGSSPEGTSRKENEHRHCNAGRRQQDMLVSLKRCDYLYIPSTSARGKGGCHSSTSSRIFS